MLGGNGFGSRGMNPMAMQAAMGGGSGMPFFGGAFGGNRNGTHCFELIYYNMWTLI